ncbi:MAG: RDD family protein [Chitinophagaceae bacterium]|nr:RDD family protein [Chitinophagaceae bacterium]
MRSLDILFKNVYILCFENFHHNKRLKAFIIDYFIILIYIGLLLGATLSISAIFHLKLENVNPVIGELIAFATLTLPVILYFVISENSEYAGTIGKRKMGVQIVNKTLVKASIGQLLIRNCIKFLPWELAHFFIYRLFYFNSITETTPGWVLTGLTVSQGLAIIYLLFIIFAKDNRSVYELLSQTRVVQIVV